MSVYDMANRLAREIKNSEEYNNYKEVRKKIMKNEKSKEMLKDYQQQQMKIQSKQLSGQELTEDDQEKLENLRNIIELNPNVKKYLEAEYRVSILLNDLQKILFSDLEVGLFEDEDKESTLD